MILFMSDNQEKVDYIGYIGLARMSMHSLTKVVGQGSGLQDLFGEERTSFYLRYWGQGMEIWWGMWWGNLHTGTTFSLKDVSDLLYFLTRYQKYLQNHLDQNNWL